MASSDPKNGDDRRAHMRWSVGTPVVVVVDGKRTSCLLKDISAGGAAINIGVAATTGKPATLMVSTACSIPSEIVRVDPEESGLEFKVAEKRMSEFDQYIIGGISPADW